MLESAGCSGGVVRLAVLVHAPGAKLPPGAGGPSAVRDGVEFSVEVRASPGKKLAKLGKI